jgi:hypothetical protein
MQLNDIGDKVSIYQKFKKKTLRQLMSSFTKALY